MGESKTRDTLPEEFQTFEELAELWDKHDLTDFAEFLTPVDYEIAVHPTHEYVITLSDSLDRLMSRVLKREGVSRTALINLWVQEKLQQYLVSNS